MQRVRRAHHVVRVHDHRVRAQLLVRPGLPRQHQRAPLVGDDRHLLRDQVHPVPDGVDERHVRQPVRRQRPREVVLEIQHDRRPPRGAELLVDRVRHPLHLGRVLPVHGEVLPRGVGERDVHDPLAPLGPPGQQLPVGEQPPHDVLGQLGPVHPHDRAASLPDLRPQLRHPFLDVGLVRALPQEVPVGAQPVHADLRAAEPAHDGVAASGERVGPAPGEEPEPVGAQHPAQHLLGDVVRQQPEVVHRGPRRVREVADPEVRTQLAQHPRHQRQVVVLHDRDGALGRLLGQCLGEGPVVRLVGGPLPPELRVEDRLQGRLVQHVVHEPQHRVRDPVVRVRVHVGRHVQHPYAVLADPAPHRLAVAVAERRAHPQRTGVGPDGRQSRHEPATTPFGVQRPVLPHLVRDRPPVGGDQHLSSTEA